jgi:type I restriction enzyme S subunit
LFLEMALPLPAIEAQCRIAQTLDAIVSEVQDALARRASSTELVDSVLDLAISQLAAKLELTQKPKPLGAFLKRSRKIRFLDAAVEYSGVGTRMWGLGTYIHERRLGGDFEAERYEVKPNQFLYNEVWAHHGALGIVGDLGENLVVSRHFHVFDVDWSALERGFLQRLFQSQWFWSACTDGTVGTTGRGHMRRGHMMGILIPAPAITEQRRIVAALDALQAEVDAVKRLQAKTTTELEAFLPAILDRAFKGEL